MDEGISSPATSCEWLRFAVLSYQQLSSLRKGCHLGQKRGHISGTAAAFSKKLCSLEKISDIPQQTPMSLQSLLVLGKSYHIFETLVIS
jgi:hypothetical protein